MDKVKVPHACVNQCFKWSQGHALEDTGPQETRGILPTGAGPDTTHDHQNVSEQKEMALAPDARGGHDENARHANTAQVVSSQQRRVLERDSLVSCYCDGVGGHDGAEGCAKHCHEG